MYCRSQLDGAGRARQTLGAELGGADPHRERGGIEVTVGDRHLDLGHRVLARLAVERDRPQLPDGRGRVGGRREDRVADPERQRAVGMIGALVEALVVPGALVGSVHRVVERPPVAGQPRPDVHGRTVVSRGMLVDVPVGKDPITYVWGEMVPRIGPAAAKFSAAVYAHSSLGLREFEAARLRIAQINGCVFCQDWRTERDGVTVEDGFDDAVANWATADALDARAKLAAEYAERFAQDHHGLDDEFWTRMTASYGQEEIVELSMCLGSWIAFGRLNRVLGLDTACVLPTAAAHTAD